MYDIIGNTEIIGQAAADPDTRALMSNNPTLIGQQFTGRPAALRDAMSKLASLSQLAQSTRGMLSSSFDPCRTPMSMGEERLTAAYMNNTPIATVQREPTEAYEVPFGFASLGVPAGAIVTINLQPAATFKPNRMSVPQAIAPSFQLTGFLIGQTSLILNGNAVPAEAFSDVAYNPRGWKLPTIQVGQPATMQWQNISGAVADLRGNFWGVFVA